MFTRAGKMNFLSGQDDFFQTANQPISVRHLSQHIINRDIQMNKIGIAYAISIETFGMRIV